MCSWSRQADLPPPGQDLLPWGKEKQIGDLGIPSNGRLGKESPLQSHPGLDRGCSISWVLCSCRPNGIQAIKDIFGFGLQSSFSTATIQDSRGEIWNCKSTRSMLSTSEGRRKRRKNWWEPRQIRISVSYSFWSDGGAGEGVDGGALHRDLHRRPPRHHDHTLHPHQLLPSEHICRLRPRCQNISKKHPKRTLSLVYPKHLVSGVLSKM